MSIEVLGEQGVEMLRGGSNSIFNTEEVTEVVNFESTDYWDEGRPLRVGQEWPVCITPNLERTRIPVG